MNKILFIAWVVLVLYLFLETDAVPKWAEFLKIKWLRYDGLKEKREFFPDLKYKNYLSTYHPNFFTSLVCCQECLCVWLNIIGFSVFGNQLGGWSWFGILTLGSLISIAGLNFILKKFYE